MHRSWETGLLGSALFCAMVASYAVAGSNDHSNLGHDFPRTFSMSIGGPRFYQESVRWDLWSRHDVVILGFYPGWEQHGIGPRQMADVVDGIRLRNARVVVGQYTLLQESQDDPAHPSRQRSAKLNQENWWLRDPAGRRVQWTDRYQAWDVNITTWAPPDGNGDRYPEWLARYDYETFFRPVPEFNVWYFDNALSRPAAKAADWRGRGRNESRNDEAIARAYRLGHVRHWESAAKLKPEIMLIGNADDLSSPEYRGQLHGAFLEALIGLPWSTDTREGWHAAMARYRAALRDTKAPHIVGFNVHGRLDDYAQLRFGLASALLDDGYFSYSVAGGSYREIPWFDEFDVELGRPVEPPQLQAWRDGVYRRLFSEGMVLVNPTASAVTIDLQPGYRRIAGRQDPQVNNGQMAGRVRIGGRDGLILVRDGG